MAMESSNRIGNLKTKLIWNQVLVGIICELDKKKVKLLNFFIPRKMELFRAHENIFQRWVHLFCHYLGFDERGMVDADFVNGIDAFCVLLRLVFDALIVVVCSVLFIIWLVIFLLC